MIFILIVFQAMVEGLAENYHNIWAKKKKSDLAVKGLMLILIKNNSNNQIILSP